MPCTAVISSGRKSIHAWVKVDAADRREFDERVRMLYQHFAEYLPDEKNKNPSRFSRLPNCERGACRQELLALGIGCQSFTEWQRLKDVASAGEVWTPQDLRAFDFKNDPGKLIGDGWMGRGMACLVVGPSGIGKSSLNLQFAALFAMSRSAFGLKCVRSLKSLIIQAENSKRDAAKMLTGILEGLKVEPMSDDEDLIDRNLVFVRDNSHTGQAFIQNLPRLIDDHKPDLVWIDPILSFVGDDISRQLVISQFFRNDLNSILNATGVACFCIHHTGKPSTDKDARKGWQSSDYSYAGLGHSDLTNWARAIMVLQDRGGGLFELKLTKRYDEADIRTAEGQIVKSLWLRHSSKPGQIYWEQAEAPEPSSDKSDREPRQTKPQQIASLNLGTFLSQCPSSGEGLRELMRRLKNWLASKDCPKRSLASVSEGTLRQAVGELLDNEKLLMTDGNYFKGKQA